MNTKIKELKISNYKKKIVLDNYFLNINNIFYGTEDETNIQFSKMAMNSEKSITEKFSFYKIEDGFENEIQEYKKAITYLKSKANQIFSNDELIVFNLKYNNEYFRLECLFENFILNFNKIKFLDEMLFLFNKEKTKYIAILRMEYHYDVIIYQK